LIAIGGVLYSDAMASDIGLTTTQAAASVSLFAALTLYSFPWWILNWPQNQTSPTFMQTVPVYDIANNKW